MVLNTFPLELIDCIIQEVDPASLKACSLVQRGWSSSSQRRLFRVLYLKIEEKCLRLRRLQALLDFAPHIAPYFISMVVLDETQQGRRTASLPAMAAFAQVFRRLINLREVEVALCGDSWGPTPSVADTLREVFSAPTLARLTVSSVCRLPHLSALLGLAQETKATRLSLAFVQTLSCSATSSGVDGQAVEVQELEAANSAPIGLRLEGVESLSLMLDDRSLDKFQLYLDLSTMPVVFPNLHTLEMSILSWDQARFLQNALELPDFPKLDTFRCNLNCYIFKTDSLDCLLNLSHFRRADMSVQTRRVRYWNDQEYAASRVVDWWRRIIEASPNAVQEWTFIFPLAVFLTGEQEDSFWNRIDRLLDQSCRVTLQNSTTFPCHDWDAVREKTERVLKSVTSSGRLSLTQ